MKSQMTVEHDLSIESTVFGYRGACSCGWHGSEKDRMSDDYAYTNASDDAESHRRSVFEAGKEHTRGTRL